MAILLRKQFFLVLLLMLVTVGFASGEGTRTWEQSKFEDLSKGTAKGVAIRSVGGLELAPAFKAISTTPSTYIWSIAADSSGNLYAAAGAPARVYRITPQGQSTVIFEPQELQVQALVVDKNGVLYAATNPDGKVYRIERQAGVPEAKGKTETEKSKANGGFLASVFFDPGTKYIWDLVLDDAGNLYVATGDHGEIFRVTPKGEHSVFFKSDEAHIRVLALDAKGNLIAGSDGSGLVYRIKPSGESFVLYSAPKKEITALAIDKAGNIYAAGVGEKRPGAIPSIFPSPVTTPGPVPATGAAQPGMMVLNVSPSPSALVSSIPLPGAGASGGSEIYRIAPDGSPSRVWASRDDLVYALAFDPRDACWPAPEIAATFLPSLAKTISPTCSRPAPPRSPLSPTPRAADSMFPPAISARCFCWAALRNRRQLRERCVRRQVFSRWGRAELRGTGKVELFARSGNVDNPDRNWSPWTRVDLQKDPVLNVPPARFVQWKAVLHAGNPAPSVDSVLLNYLPKNVAPDFDDVNVQVGVRYQPLPKAVADPGHQRDSGRRSAAAFRCAATQHARLRFHRREVDGPRRQRRPDGLLGLLPRRRRNPLAAAERQSDRQVLFLRRLAASRRRLHRQGAWPPMRRRILPGRRLLRPGTAPASKWTPRRRESKTSRHRRKAGKFTSASAPRMDFRTSSAPNIPWTQPTGSLWNRWGSCRIRNP